MNIERTCVASLVAAVLVAVTGASNRGEKKSVTMNGYVLDSACAFIKNLKKPVSRECAVACAKAGSPLVVLGDDGAIYWPISDSMPAAGQNERLIKFAGARVTVRGMVFEKGGSRALVIDKIETAPPE